MTNRTFHTSERHSLPSGATLIEMRGDTPGATLTLLGGEHGDEEEGVLAILQVLNELHRQQFSGLIRAVAPANPAAWATFSRTNPLDEGNLARCFPGDRSAGPTSRLAADITDTAIEGADFLISLHSAGARYAMPRLCGFIAGTPVEARSREAAEAFGADYIWLHRGIVPGRSLSVAAERDIPAIYAECRGGGQIRSNDLDAYIDGVLNVMRGLKMISEGTSSHTSKAPQWVYGSGDLDDGALAGVHGLFTTSVHAGQPVKSGSEIGRLYGYDGIQLQTVCAPRDGIVMFLRRFTRVQPDDVLFVLGRLSEQSE